MEKNTGKVESPCNGDCYIESATGLCHGCSRTRDEIFEWSVMDSFDRLVVLEHIKKRKLAIASQTKPE